MKKSIACCIKKMAVGMLALFAFLIPPGTHAALSPEVNKGLTWLQSQVATDGSLANEDVSIGTALQNRSESLHTLKLLANLPPSMADLLAGDTETSTEYLARRALALSIAGLDNGAQLALLGMQQNSDGGFGGAVGLESNASDTARALLAYGRSGLGSSPSATSARYYLVGQVQLDGGMPGATDTYRLSQSALGLAALQTVANDVATKAAVQKISSWLMQKQAVGGSWGGDPYLTALVLSAVHSVTTDSTLITNAGGFLLGWQSADGSWGGDPLVTALALRALAYEATSGASESSISGQLVDQAASVALSGATIILDGNEASSVVTGSDGAFSFKGLTAGTHTLQFIKAGYAELTRSDSVSVGQSLNLGTIGMAQLVTTGIVRGQVVEGTTGLPLSGVSITVSGSTVDTALTDAMGRYEIASILPGEVTVFASLSSYNTVSGTGIMAGGSTLVFSPSMFMANDPNAPTTGHFVGQVVSAGTGLPLAGVSIQLNGVTAGSTGADGRFDLEAAPTNYHALIAMEGYNSAKADFMLTAGATVSAGKIALAKQLTHTAIHGVVSDLASGSPIGGATVQVLDGASVITGIDGGYSLTELSGLTFDLRVSAVGYTSQNLQFHVSQPSDIAYDFALQAQSGNSLELSLLEISTTSAPSMTDVVLTSAVSNPATSGDAVSGVLFLDVMNSQGEVVGAGEAYDEQWAGPLGVVSLAPGESVPVVLRWNTAQFAPGTYTLAARLSEVDSTVEVNPRGVVLAERSATVNVIATPHFTGTVTADPPVLRAQTNTSVHLSAVLQNDGNVELPGQIYQLRIVTQGTEAVVAAQDVAGSSLLPGALQNLTFADWVPTDGGDYRVDVVGADATQGRISVAVYVGDSATGNFTVSKTVVPAGTQTVKANIHISGQDVTQGTISDPLAPLIKAAIQKAVTYNDQKAANWTTSNGCLGCHVASQALVGGELTSDLSIYNKAYRELLINALSTRVQSNGSILASHTQFSRTQTILGLWALNAARVKNEIVATLVKAANYLVNRQEAGGRWTADHVSGWWAAPSANTAFGVKNLIEVSQTLKQAPEGSVVNYTRQSWVGGVSNAYYLASDADSNVYVSNTNAGTVSKISPTGSIQTVMSAGVAIHAPLIAPDGTMYVASQSGLFKRNADGTSSKIATVPGAGLAWGPDGNLYMANYWNNVIYKITPEGVVTNYINGGVLKGPIGLAFSAAGDLIVANYGNSRILRYKADKSYEVVVDWVYGSPRNIVAYGNEWLVATTAGLFRYNSDWKGERVLFTLAHAVTVTPDGRILVSDNTSTIYKVAKSAINPATQLATLDTSIAKGVNWLLADTTYNQSSNLDLAHRLIGFGVAKEYYAGTEKEASVQIKMDQTAELLRSRQRADGGWGKLITSGSDSMVTAQVGVALDYMNPSPKDPIVQNAIKYLLSRQQADGSWLSENGIMGTRLAATTWVAIWLPIALDRIGGIDSDLTLTLPANVTLTNPSVNPISSQPTEAGGNTYVWSLQGATSEGMDVSFDATLHDLGVNEIRPVALDAHLSFANTFSEGQVTAPIAIPSVTGSAFMTLGVATDRPQYGPDEPVAISTVVSNLADVTNSGTVRLAVHAADKVLVKDLGTVPFGDIAALGQQEQMLQWNTGPYLTGGYYVQGALFDTQNRLVASATAQFDIVNGLAGSSVNAGIAVDKQAYRAYDAVRVSDRIANLAKNQPLNDLVAVTTIFGPDGAGRWTTSASLGQIVVGDRRDLAYSVPLVNAPAGSYRAVLVVQNAAGTTVATAETAFSVQSSADTGSGLQGAVTAEPKRVPQGDAALLSDSVENLGNSALASLPLTLSVVDPASQQILTQWQQTVDLAQGGSIQYAYSMATDNLPVGSTYVAVLTAVLGGKTLTLAQDSFVVVEPPVKLSVSQVVKPAARVLVLVSCHEVQGVIDSNGAVSAGPNQECLANRTTFLDQYLTGLGLAHRIVVDDETFRDALRSGSYNTYWISGGREKLHESIAEEVREAVFRGDALILDGVHDQRNKVLNEAAGIVYRGKLNPTALPMSVNGAVFPAANLGTQGRALSVLLAGSTQQAVFGGSPSDGVSKQGATYPAIVANQFGQGRSFTFTFDLVASLQAQTAAVEWQSLIQAGFGYVMPPLPTAYSGRDFWTLHTEIANLAREVDLAITTMLPAGSILLSGQPNATLDVNGNPVWNFRLPAEATQPLDLALRLPTATGSYRVETLVDWIRDGNTKRYGEYVWNVDVGAALDTAAPWPGEIAALAVGNSERESRDKAAAYLSEALSLAGWERYGEALGKLISAVEALRKIQSIDISAPRLKIDRLLKEVGYHAYCASAAILPAECGQ